MSNIAKIITGHNVYVNGENFAGRIYEQELPDIDETTIRVKTAGMRGSVPIKTGIEDMQSTYTFEEHSRQLMGLSPRSPVRFITSGYQDNGRETAKIEVEIGGFIKTKKLGTFGQDGNPRLVIVVDVDYYRYSDNDREVIEIDLINSVYKVEGVDHWEDLRNKLNL